MKITHSLPRGIAAAAAAVLCLSSPAVCASPAAQALCLTAETAVGGTPGSEDGRAVRLIGEGETLEWRFSVTEATKRQLQLTYAAADDGSADLKIAIALDGANVRDDGKAFTLRRIWHAETDAATGRFALDSRGSELLPAMTQIRALGTAVLTAKDDNDEALYLSLTPGEHTLRLTAERCAVAVEQLALSLPEELPDEETYRAAQAGRPDGAADFCRTIEAELATAVSDRMIVPLSDRSGPDASPSDADRTLLNCIGAERCSTTGQWIEWTFTVPQDGAYTFSFRYLQNFRRGLAMRRRIEIDGSVPFAELAEVSFPYGTDWQDISLPGSVWLTAGEHTLRMSVTLGQTAQALSQLSAALSALNTWYRRIVMVTGTQPDFYRDYYLETELPELIPALRETAQQLRDGYAALRGTDGADGDHAAFLAEMIRQLDDFVRDSRSIPERLSSFKGNLGSFAELLAELHEQPLKLDTVTVCGAAASYDPPKVGLFGKLAFRAQLFLASFTQDYRTLGGSTEGAGGKPIKVWVSVSDMMTSTVASGRDQAQAIKRLIDDRFTPQSGLSVDLSLVSTGDTLTQSIMAGKGPDAALFVADQTPIALAARDALVDLYKLDGYDAIAAKIHPAALIACRYGGGVYALPETMVWPMLFVRDDVFAELGLTVPDTWDDLYRVMARLQKKNLQVGIPEDLDVFELLLLQNGGTLYREDMSATALDSAAAQKAFRMWTELYLQYDLDVALNFFNRFRTGEMPIGITDHTMFDQLSVAAPEIGGLWSIHSVPGTVRDGKIDRSVSCSGASCILLSSSQRQEDAWHFLRWWLDSDTQRRFAADTEAVLGTAARYNSADRDVFFSLDWTNAERTALLTQDAFVTDIPVSPAGYYVTRGLTNAFRRVVYRYQDPVETLERYQKDIDAEMTRKLAELAAQ